MDGGGDLSTESRATGNGIREDLSWLVQSYNNYIVSDPVI